MTSPCKRCQFLSADGSASCFAVMMDIPFTEAEDFEGELPDECVELAFFREVVEEFEDEEYSQKNETLLREYRALVWVLEENQEAIKNDWQRI